MYICSSKTWINCLSGEKFDCYLSRLTGLFKADLNCSNSFALSRVHKVTMGTESFVSVILDVVSFVSLDNTLFSDQFKMRLTSQLI